MGSTEPSQQAYQGHKFTYSAPHDPPLKRMVIRAVEGLSGRRRWRKEVIVLTG